MNRRKVSLNGKWSYVLDQYNRGEQRKFMLPVKDSEAPGKLPVDHDAEEVDLIDVPSSWNTAVRELKYYEQSLWYYRHFKRPENKARSRVFLHFEGSYYRTKVWLNSKEVGEHLGGFTPFEFDVTDLLGKNNLLAVMVNSSRDADRAPTTITDWFTYGGIYRDVYLELRSARHVTDHFVYMDRAGRNIRGRIGATHAGVAEVEIPELGISHKVKISAKDHSGAFAVPVPAKLERWSFENPKLYNVTVSFAEDSVKDRIGFRTMAVKGDNILLNGEPVYLKGVSAHEDHWKRGRALTDKDREDVFRLAKDLNCNFLRLAHYPHSRRMAEMADEKGILLWEEIPVYWKIQWKNRKTYKDVANQLKELIGRDRNRASVGMWSIANETPQTEPGRNEFLSSLSRLARRMDPSRLVTAAMFMSREDEKRVIKDPLASAVDVIGINEYLGWYGPKKPKKAEVMTNLQSPGKPVIISEFGAGARAGVHGSMRFSEEYQARVYKQQIKCLAQPDCIKGMTPWILIDFRAPRYNRYQRGYNVKGLVDADRKTKKKAFDVYSRFTPPPA